MGTHISEMAEDFRSVGLPTWLAPLSQYTYDGFLDRTNHHVTWFWSLINNWQSTNIVQIWYLYNL